jgi:hypothetical protein
MAQPTLLLRAANHLWARSAERHITVVRVRGAIRTASTQGRACCELLISATVTVPWGRRRGSGVVFDDRQHRAGGPRRTGLDVWVRRGCALIVAGCGRVCLLVLVTIGLLSWRAGCLARAVFGTGTATIGLNSSSTRTVMTTPHRDPSCPAGDH